MQPDSVPIPEDLRNLKSSEDLESFPVSRLARQGTSVLQRILTTDEGVTVEVQGQGAMVTVSRRQYDEMVAVIRRLSERDEDDGFTQALGARFDDLVARMNRSGAGEATDAALFADPAMLNRTYKPGSTETES